MLDTSGAALRHGLAGRPDLVKPNAAELRALTTPADTGRHEVGAARALSCGARAVVVSRGPDGLFALTRDQAWRCVPPERLTGNPTGAGDACVAALARGLRDRTPWPELLADAVALSAAAVAAPARRRRRPRDLSTPAARRARPGRLRGTAMLTPTAEIVAAARAAGGGVGAFNVITVEHAEAIVTGAEEAGLPVILQISENAVRFHQGWLAPIAAAARAVADSSRAAVALHLDHVESDELFDQAAAHGFGSVMYDASASSYADNVAATAAAVRRGRRRGLWVESELGAIGGKDGAHAPGARTDPGEAAAYVAATGVDALAVAVGSSHAMRTRTARLDHELIGRLRAAVPVPLVLHGSSGVPDDELVAAVRHGMVKINIGTALNSAFTGAVRASLDGDAALVDPRRYLAPARAAMARHGRRGAATAG
nr:hypothetical protein GCM10020092_041920 [Actinoplanes digitatis]